VAFRATEDFKRQKIGTTLVRLGASVETVGEEVRKEVDEATEPDEKSGNPP
jgi:hypothetical protein